MYHWLTRYGDEEARARIDFELSKPIPGISDTHMDSRSAEQEMADFLAAMGSM